MNTFVFLREHFARYVLPDLSNDAVADCKRALTMNHLLVTGKSGRLSGWVMVKKDKTYIQAKIAAKHANLITADPRTRYEAWYEELENFSGPTCFIEFTKSTFNIGNIFLTHDARVVKICGPASSQTFNYTDEPNEASGVAHKVLAKMRRKNAV
jgi:hypothetical protein